MPAMLRALVASEVAEERAFVKDHLRARGGVGTCIVASDGIETCNAVREALPDLAVLSAGLPGIDCVALLRGLALQDVRTLVLLGPGTVEGVREILKARPSGILVRPFGATALRRRIELVLSRPAQRARDVAPNLT